MTELLLRGVKRREATYGCAVEKKTYLTLVITVQPNFIEVSFERESFKRIAVVQRIKLGTDRDSGD